MDPYASPSSDETAPVGTLNLMQAISEGVGAALANVGSAVGVVFVSFVVVFFGTITCGLAYIPLAPLLAFGVYKWSLQSLDGAGQVSTLWSFGDRWVEAMLRMWGYFGIWLLLMLPMFAVIGAITFPGAFEAALSGDQPDPVMQTVKTTIPSILIGFLFVRLYLAPFFIVDRNKGPVEAFQLSWACTRGQWLKLIGLQLVLILLGLPAQVLNLGFQMYAAGLNQNNLDEVMQSLPIMLAFYLGMVSLAAVVYILNILMHGSVFRQLVGTAADEAV